MEVKVHFIIPDHHIVKQELYKCLIERGYFSSRVTTRSDISIIANTSLEVCSDVAVLVIERVKDNDTSDSASVTTAIGGVVVNFTGSTDQYRCTPHIELPSGQRLSFPGFNCSTGKFSFVVGIKHSSSSYPASSGAGTTLNLAAFTRCC